MKDEALELAQREGDPLRRLNILREYIQAFALRSLHESRAFECLSFVGGTALRFVYDLPRWSEDLDFSMESAAGYSPRDWLSKLKRDLAFSGFEADITWNERKAVHTAWIRVHGILFEAGLSGHKAEKLSIKLEIDSKPPRGAGTETRVISRHFMFGLRHHDLPSMMAGKVHAILTRGRDKGRDWYDLLWYCSRRPPVEPKQSFLEAALQLTGGEIPASWSATLRSRLEVLDLSAIRADIQPFLERREDLMLLTKEHLLSILGDRG
jgi:predicted nucleotidyltransferase component of viral defense system